MRFKKRFFISASCLSLGLIVSLGIVMISRGTDTRNEIEHEEPDIYVTTLMSSDNCQGHEEHILFPDDLVGRILDLPGIESSIVSRGCFAEVLVEEEALELRNEDIDSDTYFYRAPCTVQIMSDEWLAELKTFAQEQNLYLDVDAVMEGEGVILLHDHMLSPAQIEMSKDTVGMSLGMYHVVNKKKAADMRFCGYLDLEQEGLPKFNFTWIGTNTVYLLIGEKGFPKLNTDRQNFSLDITTQQGSRLTLSREVEKIVNGFNEQFGVYEGGYWDERMLQVKLKIDTLQEMKDYIVSNRLVLGALCGILLLMGIINYMDVTITGLTVRKKEFAVMESIGLTRKQLRKMLILEGIFYSLIITVLTGILGGGVLFLTGKAMHQRMEYFVVQYPVVEFAACVIALFLSCIAIVLILYRKYGEESISLRLRIYAD